MNRHSAYISLGQIKRNIRDYRHHLPQKTAIMAIIKANAYGLGAVPIAQALETESADYFGVASLPEAVELRLNGIKRPVLILSESYQGDMRKIVGLRLTQTVYTPDYVKKLNDAAGFLNASVKVHVKVDTGMNRVGCRPEDALSLCKYIGTLPYIRLEGIFTHFANSDNTASPYTQAQFHIFSQVLSELSSHGFQFNYRHAANSDAVKNFPETQLDMVRIGLGLYEDALTLKSFIGFKKLLQKGSSVSYGSEYTAPTDKQVGTVVFGYGDGYPRLTRNGRVMVNNTLCPILGRICMDMFLIDLDGVPRHTTGNEVILIEGTRHSPISLNDLAQRSGHDPREILCRLTQRVDRIYTN